MNALTIANAPAGNGPARLGNPPEEEYPTELRLLEEKARAERDLGLALSGGGIRSATFCLGFLQSLAKNKVLSRVGFLSTVSGGGYIGGFLGALFTRAEDLKMGVEDGLLEARSFTMQWLRENGRYLAPNGSGDLMSALAVMIRNWLSVLIAMGLLALLPFFVMDSIRAVLGHFEVEWLARHFPAPQDLRFWWSSPLLALAAMPFYAAAAFGWSYWLVGKYRKERPIARPFALHLFVVAGAAGAIVFLLLAETGLVPMEKLALVGLCGLPVIAAVIHGGSWCWARWKLGFDPEQSALRQRRQLTDGLSSLLLATGVMLGLGLVDSLGQSIYLSIHEHGFTASMKMLAAAVGASAILSVGPKLLGLLPRAVLDKLRGLSLTIVASAASLILLMLFLVAGNVFTHAICWWGADPKAPGAQMLWLASVSGLVVTACLTLVAGHAPLFLHTSSLQMLYGFRLARAYLGATNIRRKEHPENLAVTDMIPGDDLWLTEYRPQQHGGPLHLVNLTFNETCSAKSNIEQRDRKGLSFAVGPYGLSVGRNHHARWAGSEPERMDAAIRPINPPIDPKAFAMFPLRCAPQITDLPLFVQKLRDPANAASGFVFAGLSEKTRSLLDARQALGNYTAELKSALTADLERLVRGPLIYNRERFRDVVSDSDAEMLAKTQLEGDDLLHANAALLLHAYPTELGAPAFATESLSVGHWLALSGAAIGTGLGSRTKLSLSLLAGFANLRLGYWWDSNIDPDRRPKASRTKQDFSNLLARWFTKLLPVHSYLLDEWLARFHGPARQLWQLSDGGHFENSAVYELLRRRLPRIICCDCGEDPEFHFDDLANLVRKARLDFAAEMTFFTRAQLDALKATNKLPAEVWNALATPEEIASTQHERRKKGCAARGHALLAEVTYKKPEGAKSLILFVKPAVTGEETLDLLEYSEAHTQFPHESTGDQFFDEAQW